MAEEKKFKISALIIAFNSETHIKDCLESAKWADEIIIVDSFSSDKTVQIARQYTDRIWQRPWPGFARQRNFGIEKAAGDWIFILDTDERITPELKKEIEAILTNESGINGYFLSRKTFFLGKWIQYCGWYPDYNIRLIRKGSARYDESRLVHERVSIEGKTAYLKNPILHYSYPTIFEYVDRMNKYTSLAAQQMQKDGTGIKKTRIKGKALKKMFKTFWKMYVKRQGFRDGMRGLFLCFFSSFYQFMVYAKYWEILGKGRLK